MRVSSYYCDICGKTHPRNELHPFLIVSGLAKLFGSQEVCDPCMATVTGVIKSKRGSRDSLIDENGEGPHG